MSDGDLALTLGQIVDSRMKLLDQDLRFERNPIHLARSCARRYDGIHEHAGRDRSRD